MNQHFVIIGKLNCPYCIKAKSTIRERGDTYESFELEEHPSLREFLQSSGLSTVPQIFEDGYLIGGYDDLIEWYTDVDAEEAMYG